jgi:hypothetical protein
MSSNTNPESCQWLLLIYTAIICPTLQNHSPGIRLHYKRVLTLLHTIRVSEEVPTRPSSGMHLLPLSLYVPRLKVKKLKLSL